VFLQKARHVDAALVAHGRSLLRLGAQQLLVHTISAVQEADGNHSHIGPIVVPKPRLVALMIRVYPLCELHWVT